MLIKISVIIPVYNTAKYLKECLDSVLNQSFDDFEVICVNDGSTDNSLEILESYDDDKIVIINQEHKGASAARNIAIKKSQGEYILFIDSDDYIALDTLNEVYELANSKSLDLLFFKLINFNEKRDKIKLDYFEMEYIKDIVDGEVFDWHCVKDFLFKLPVTAPSKLFKRDLIKNIEFPEDVIFEDNVFFIRTILNAKRMYFYDKHLYFRRLRDESITNSFFENFSDCITIYGFIANHLKEMGVYEELFTQFFNRQCSNIHIRFTQLPIEFKKDYFDKAKEYFLENKNSFENEETFDKCPKRSLIIFNSAIDSDTYKEFELSVDIFDLKVKKDSLNKKLRKLKKENKQYKKEINALKNSNKFKITSIFRK